MSQFVVEFQGHITAAQRPLLQTNSRRSLNTRLELLLPVVPAWLSNLEKGFIGAGKCA